MYINHTQRLYICTIIVQSKVRTVRSLTIRTTTYTYRHTFKSVSIVRANIWSFTR